MAKTPKEILDNIKKIVGIGEPKAADFKTKDGKVLSISEDGTTATIDGQPASGSFVLEDGKTVVCENGAVKSISEAQAAQPAAPVAPNTNPVTPAPAPAPAPQTAEQRIAAMQEELNKIKAEKEAADKVKADAEAKLIEATKEKEKSVQALAKIKEEMEKEPVGDQTAPERGSKPFIGPVAIGGKTDDAQKALMASRTFIADTMPWLERHYKDGKYPDGSTFNSYRSGGPNAVSILETNFNYTWNGVLTTDLFFKPALGVPALADFFSIDLGSKDKKVYNLVNPIDKVLQPYTGCGGTPAGNRQRITNTSIQLKPFQMYESWCKDDFTTQLSGTFNILAQEWLKTGNASFDPAGTPINNIIMDTLQYALKKDVHRRVFFAAQDSADADYNQIDGFWTRNIDSSGASNYCVYKYGSTLGTGAISADAIADTYLPGIYNNSNLLLKEVGIDTGKAVLWVTRSVWENYYNSLAKRGDVAPAQYELYRKGEKTLDFRGIPVKPINLWDSLLAESDNPLFSTTRHLIVLTLKDNHILGVENNADLDKIESWFEMKDQKRYYRSNMIFGYQYLHCDLTTISY